MSQEALAIVLGRAAIDDEYLAKLKANPQAAVREMKVRLHPDEVPKLERLIREKVATLEELNKAAKERGMNYHFDL